MSITWKSMRMERMGFEGQGEACKMMRKGE